MNHEQAKQRWHDCTDQGGSDPELEAHLTGCPSCRTYVRQMEATMRLLDAARHETERIVPRPVCRSAPRDPAGVWVPGWLRAAAMVAIVTGVSYLALRVTRTATDRWSLVADHPVSRPDAPRLSFGLTLRGESAKRAVAVADPVSTADVQVYWLYSSLIPQAGETDTPQDGTARQQGRVDPEKRHAAPRVSVNERILHDHRQSKGNRT